MPEFEFNLALAREILATLHAAGFSRSFLIGESGAPMELRERTATAERAGARVLVSSPSRQRSTQAIGAASTGEEMSHRVHTASYPVV